VPADSAILFTATKTCGILAHKEKKLGRNPKREVDLAYYNVMSENVSISLFTTHEPANRAEKRRQTFFHISAL